MGVHPASEADQETAGVRAALDQWREQHPQATFEEIEDEVYRQLAVLHARWSGELALAPPPHGGEREEEPERPEGPACGACGAALCPSGVRSRQVVTRMGAATTFTRGYWVCPACGAGHFPPG